MKKRYKILIGVLITEFSIISILNEFNVKIQSWIGNVVGAFLYFLPIQILLFL